jgi:AbrB family looped-hinge helix DNA binding protein
VSVRKLPSGRGWGRECQSFRTGNRYLKIKETEMALMKIRKNYQVTIPRNLRDRFNLAEGDYLEVETSNGAIVLKPVKVIQPDQEYFYTKQWQEKEAEVDEEVGRGDIVGPFDNAKDAIKALKTVKI